MASHDRALMEAPAASFPAEGSREPPPPLPARAVENKSLVLVDGIPDNALATKAGFKAELAAVEAGLRTGTLDGGAFGDGQPEENLAELQLQAARKLRQLLSTNRELLIQEVLDRNWVPLLLGWLQLHQRPAVQVEALWALTNIAAGTAEHTSVLIKHGAVPTLVDLLSSPNEEVLEQAIWVLGNFAGEGAPSRDAVLSHGALQPLVACLLARSGSGRSGVGGYGCSLSLLRIGSWALSNLCDGQPRPVVDIHAVLPVLAALLQSADAEVLSHACWALSHLCDGPSAHISAVVGADVCWRLVQLLTHRSWRVTKPALRTIGNIVCAEDETDYTQHILEAGAVPCLRQLIAHTNREIQKEACWTLSNVAAGSIDQIQTVLDSGAVPSLVALASAPGTDPEVKNEACWVVLNATSCGSDLQIEYLVAQNCVAVLGELLGEPSMVLMALEGLERILQVGDDEARRAAHSAHAPSPHGCGHANPYAALLATSRLEELESHKSSAIAKRATRVWKAHFVACALCNRAYSKHSADVRVCAECKCPVCSSCNCEVFHLSYQEALWRELESTDLKGKAAAAVAKRSKNKKKKKRADKDKSKRATASASGGKGAASSSAKGGSKAGDNDDDDAGGGGGSDNDNDDDEDEDEPSPSAVPTRSRAAAPAKQPAANRGSRLPEKRASPSSSSSPSAAAAVAATSSSGGAAASGSGGGKRSMAHAQPAAAAAAAAASAAASTGCGPRPLSKNGSSVEDASAVGGGGGDADTGGVGSGRRKRGAVGRSAADTSDSWPTTKKGANDNASRMTTTTTSTSHPASSGTATGHNLAATIRTSGTSTTAAVPAAKSSTDTALPNKLTQPKNPANSRTAAKAQPISVAPGSSETKGNRGSSQSTQGSDNRNGAGPKGTKSGSSSSTNAKSAAKASRGGGSLTESGEGGQHDSSGDLVSYLQQTGSILALAEMLDGADTDDVTDEDMRLLQEAASARQVAHTANGHHAKAN